MTNTNFSPVLEQFVDRMLTEKKLDSLEPEILEQAKKDILIKAEELIKATIYSHIPSDKLDEFDKLMDANDEAALQVFIQQQIPNLQELIAQSLLDFRNTYLG